MEPVPWANAGEPVPPHESNEKEIIAAALAQGGGLGLEALRKDLYVVFPQPMSQLRFELVANLAHDLFQNVLLGHQTLGYSEFILDQCHVAEGPLHLREQTQDGFPFGNSQDRLEDRRDLLPSCIDQFDQVLEMDDSEHVVDILIVYRHTGVAALQKCLEQLLGRQGRRDSILERV